MTQDSEAPVAGEPAAGAAGPAVYVYGVVRAAEATNEPLPGGVAGHRSPVRLVAHDDLALVLSDVPPDWRAATRADVEAHEAVLSALIEHQTVIPMRFGMVLPSEQKAREALLARHHAQLGSPGLSARHRALAGSDDEQGGSAGARGRRPSPAPERRPPADAPVP
jgi:hypothetical protein